MANTSDYFSTVQKALSHFQFIEEGLKMYLANTFQLIRKNIKSDMVFGFTYKDVEDYSLGRLIKIFEKYNSNKNLIKTINKIIKDRNYIAHKSFLLTSKEIKQLPDRELNRVKKIENQASKCIKELFLELEKMERLDGDRR